MTGSIGQTSSGAVFIGGTSSGINTTALIDAAVAQKTRRADLLQIEIDGNTSRIGAYDELRALTDSLEASLRVLRGPESLFDTAERAFDLKSGTVLTSDGSDFSSYLDIAIGSEAVSGNYEIEVLEVARAERVGSNSIVDDAAALGYAGTFNLGLSGVGTASISVAAGDSLRDLRDAINVQSDTIGVTASILKVSETEFQLILTGSETSQSIVTNYTSGDNVLDLIGINKEQFGAVLATRTAGQSATLDGIVDNQSTQQRITFTTPAATPTSVPGQVIFESGGTGQGIGLYLDSNNQLAYYAGNATTSPLLISPDVLLPNTQYSVVVEIDIETDQIRLNYQASSNFDFFYAGRPAEAELNGFTQTNISGGNGTGVGEVGGGSTGGYNGTVSGVTNFQGTIDSDLIVTGFPATISTGIFQPASGARISFGGVEITRDDNSFDDLIEGIDLTTKNAAPGTIISLEVGNDVASTKDAIVAFIDAYNAFRDFVIRNQQVDSSGQVSENAVLFSDNLLNGLTDQYSNLIGQSFNNGGVIETIRDLGIKIGNNNKLEISDEAKLDSALLNNFDDVKLAFASGAQTDNNEFRLTGNTSLGGSQSIVFDLTTDGAGTITGVTANGDGSAFTISGSSIVGAAGTAFAGLRFTYVGTDTNVTINADLTQGLADKLINGGKPYTDSVTGLIIQQKATLQSENQDKSQDISEIIARAEIFRQNQIDRYAKLEADSVRLNLLLDQIRAILGNNDDDN